MTALITKAIFPLSLALAHSGWGESQRRPQLEPKGGEDKFATCFNLEFGSEKI